MASQQARLPVELYVVIVSHLHSPRDTRELHALVITSKAISWIAIRELYRSVSCVDGSRAEQFFNRVAEIGKATEQRSDSDVTNFVRELTFSVKWNESSWVMKRMCEGLQSLHRLQVLEIRERASNEQAPVNLERLLEHIHCNLTHLCLKLRFHYDDHFEQHLSRHAQTLEVLQLYQPAVWMVQESALRGPFRALKAIAAPAYQLRRLLSHSEPTKIWDMSKDKHLQVVLKGEGRRVTSYTGHGPEHGNINTNIISPLAAQLQFVRLHVEIKREDPLLYEPLTSLISLRAIELIWDIRRNPASPRAGGKYTPMLKKRLKSMINTCFERCPSPQLQFIFSIVQGNTSKDYGQKWTRGVDEGVDFVEWEGLWMKDW